MLQILIVLAELTRWVKSCIWLCWRGAICAHEIGIRLVVFTGMEYHTFAGIRIYKHVDVMLY